VDVSQFWTTFNQNHTRKFGLSVRGCPRRLKMNDSRHLQHCRAVVWNVAANFVRWAQHAVHCSKICANLLSNVLRVFFWQVSCSTVVWQNLWTYEMICLYVCNDQNEYCIAVCTELKEQAENDSNFIAGDESWVFGYNFETKQQLSQWRTPTSRWPKKAQQVQSFWGGVPLKASCIRNLFRQDRRWIATFQGDWRKMSNTNVQTSATTPGPCIMTTLQLMDHLLCSSFWLLWTWQSCPTPPYSLDLTPCDFFLFPKLKLKLKGQCFDSIKEIQA
jgi:hypothetical protein